MSVLDIKGVTKQFGTVRAVDSFALTVGDGELVCLVMIEGTVYAFTDNCTHISGPLNEGALEGCAITCPWHRAQFDVRTGKVLRGPARQDLMTYPVKVEDNAVFISLPPEE